MARHKNLRKKGKLSLSKLFEEFKEGDTIVLVHNLSYSASFPKRLHGRTGKVIGKQGKALIIKVNDGKKPKNFVVQRIHLKKLSA